MGNVMTWYVYVPKANHDFLMELHMMFQWNSEQDETGSQIQMKPDEPDVRSR